MMKSFPFRLGFHGKRMFGKSLKESLPGPQCNILYIGLIKIPSKMTHFITMEVRKGIKVNVQREREQKEPTFKVT